MPKIDNKWCSYLIWVRNFLPSPSLGLVIGVQYVISGKVWLGWLDAKGVMNVSRLNTSASSNHGNKMATHLKQYVATPSTKFCVHQSVCKSVEWARCYYWVCHIANLSTLCEERLDTCIYVYPTVINCDMNEERVSDWQQWPWRGTKKPLKLLTTETCKQCM